MMISCSLVRLPSTTLATGTPTVKTDSTVPYLHLPGMGGEIGGIMSSDTISWNHAITNSIPINRKRKDLILLKYRWLAKHNGLKYTSDVFSSARTWLMGRLAGVPEKDLGPFPLGRRILEKILPSVLSSPHAWLDLFKIYTSVKSPLISVEKSQEEMKQRLSRKWEGVVIPPKWPIKVNRMADPEKASFTLPDPSWYSDWSKTQPDVSYQYNDDVGMLANLTTDRLYGPLFTESMIEAMQGLINLQWAPVLRYVGQIHHIPKSGTVKRRPIAVPNRFLQVAFEPFNQFLREEILKKIPADCTFDQNRFTNRIQQRLDEGLYVGSADLSAASDNLPRDLALEMLWALDDHYVNRYIGGINRLCLDRWWNGEEIVRFKTGQPLGVLPSFPLLALANHTLVWIAQEKALGHIDLDGYALLGDDIVFFDKSVRDTYLEEARALDVPISLHKSYEGNLVEFAGRVFIKNHPPWYTPDHGNLLTKANLFDYQRAGGIRIPWDNLPKSIRSWWRSAFTSHEKAVRGYNLSVAFSCYLGPGVNDVVLVRYITEIMSNETLSPDTINQERLVPVYRYLVPTSVGPYTSRNREQSDWWTTKWRPVMANHLRRTASAVLDSNPFEP